MRQAEKEYRQRETESHDFLLLRHGDIGFLLDRTRFCASIYLEHAEPLKIETTANGIALPEYFNKTIHYNGESLLLFDLDVYLAALFGIKDQGKLKIALITGTGGLRSEHYRLFSIFAEKLYPEASLSFLAFKAGSQAEVCRIPLDELKLFPFRIRKKLVGDGILGCRFLETGKVDYIIDLERLIFNNLSRTETGVIVQ